MIHNVHSHHIHRLYRLARRDHRRRTHSKGNPQLMECRKRNGERQSFPLPLPSDSTAETDIYVLPIDNYVDTSKENTIIATSKPVILLFSEYHDEDNTIPAELKEVEALKNEKVPNCVKATYNGNRDFQRILIATLESLNTTK